MIEKLVENNIGSNSIFTEEVEAVVITEEVEEVKKVVNIEKEKSGKTLASKMRQASSIFRWYKENTTLKDWQCNYHLAWEYITWKDIWHYCIRTVWQNPETINSYVDFFGGQMFPLNNDITDMVVARKFKGSMYLAPLNSGGNILESNGGSPLDNGFYQFIEEDNVRSLNLGESFSFKVVDGLVAINMLPMILMATKSHTGV